MNAEAATSGWRAGLQLGFRYSPAKTILARRRHYGPLTVQRALYPEDRVCHVYLLHPPGGVAGGDELLIEADVGPRAHGLVTTPGATKFYHSTGLGAAQHQQLQVRGGTLEWFPQENIFFPGARVELSTTVSLSGDAHFIGWEMQCLGRPVINETFDTGLIDTRLCVERNGHPLLLERWTADGRSLSGAAGLRGRPVVGSLYATVEDSTVLSALRDSLRIADDDELALTWVDGLLVARYLGGSTARARQYFTEIWMALRPYVVKRPACPPRIWTT